MSAYAVISEDELNKRIGIYSESEPESKSKETERYTNSVSKVLRAAPTFKPQKRNERGHLNPNESSMKQNLQAQHATPSI